MDLSEKWRPRHAHGLLANCHRIGPGAGWWAGPEPQEQGLRRFSMVRVPHFCDRAGRGMVIRSQALCTAALSLLLGLAGCAAEAKLEAKAPEPPAPVDADNDGVPDNADNCPDEQEDGKG